mgnify:CR=1 FL=1
MISEKIKKECSVKGTAEISIKKPKQSDGKDLWMIAKQTGVLDLNSSYSYNLIATHFSETSAVTFLEDKPAGFLSAYLIPKSPQILFIWQIGVMPQYQGKGFAFAMIKNVLSRQVCQKVTSINTTITPSNTASRKLFQKVSHLLNAEFNCSSFYSPMDFPDTHEEEDLITIGPFNTKPNEGGFYEN